MAGIGFQLNKLFQKKGVLNLCRAYIYAGVISIGPMILYVVMLLGITLVSLIAGMDRPDREVLNCMLTYSLLVSLFSSNCYNMVVTRYVADRLYEKRYSEIMPSLYGSCCVQLLVMVPLYSTFLFFSGVPLSYGLMCLWISSVMIIVWMEMIYLMILKDYRMIMAGFTVSVMAGFLAALVMVLFQMITVVRLMSCVVLSFGIMLVWYHELLVRYFPKGKGKEFSFLEWFDRYRPLGIIGASIWIGLYGHLCIMYFGPLRHQTTGWFYTAPMYDIPALFAFFSIIITIISFVSSVEVKFFPKYRRYYSLFNDRGSIMDIEAAEEEMLDVLGQELLFMGIKQVIMTILAIVGGGFIMDLLPLGMTDLGKDIFRILCVGYGIYAMGNSVMLILLYFEDYLGAMIGTVLFAVISVSGTALQMLYGKNVYFGLGFSLGAAVFFLVCIIRLEWCTGHLQYMLLGRQEFMIREDKGPFIWLSGKLEGKEN
ncbi:MAG: exopolysaccharide Pel transporter PelG [Eubacterium sp.]|nr:exopolysaccharide Pel transporter PelG [Eubacterium sp.]